MNNDQAQALQAAHTAHRALWAGLPHTKEGTARMLERLSKIIASELFSMTGSGTASAKLLNEGLAPAVERELAFLDNDPEVKMLIELLNLTKGR